MLSYAIDEEVLQPDHRRVGMPLAACERCRSRCLRPGLRRALSTDDPGQKCSSVLGVTAVLKSSPTAVHRSAILTADSRSGEQRSVGEMTMVDREGLC